MIINDIISSFNSLTKSFSSSITVQETLSLLDASLLFIGTEVGDTVKDVEIPLRYESNVYDVEVYLNIGFTNRFLTRRFIRVNYAIDDDGRERKINDNTDCDGVMLAGGSFIQVNNQQRPDWSTKSGYPLLTVSTTYRHSIPLDVQNSMITDSTLYSQFLLETIDISESSILPIASYMAYQATLKLANSDNNLKQFLWGNFNAYIKSEQQKNKFAVTYTAPNYIKAKGFV